MIMFHYGKKPINNIYKDITNIKLLQKQITKYPEPISNLNINIDDIQYSDDFEVSILRLIHIIFGDDSFINLNKLRESIGERYDTNELFIFLSKNNKIRKYISVRQRIEWCNLLNHKSFFQYTYQNKYKLKPILNNLFVFFKIFFPNLKLNKDNKLNQIFDFFKINFEHFKNGYYTTDKIYEEINIKLFLDGNNLYNWKIYQYYENLNNCKGKLITGYSDLKYSIYLV